MYFHNDSVNTSSNTTGPPVKSEPSIAPFIVIAIIILIGVIGNSFIITIVTMINTMKTTTNLLLVNVAIADITTLLLTGIHMILYRNIPLNNSFLCKIIDPNTLSTIALTATTLTLTILSIERYNALIKPMITSRRLKKENVVFAIIGVWVVALVMTLPVMIYMDFDPRIGRCSPGKNSSSLLISVGGIVLTMTIIPFCIIAYCYSQIIAGLYFRNTICKPCANPGMNEEDLIAKKKLVKLLLTITILFFIAFVPYGVLQISIFSLTGANKLNQNIINLGNVMKYLIPVHSSINPFLYTLQSNNYREGFKVSLKKLMCLKNQRWSIRRPGSSHPTHIGTSALSLQVRRDEAQL